MLVATWRFLRLLVGAFVLSAAFARPKQPSAGTSLPVPPSEEEEYSLGDDFVYDVIARTNESVVGNIDAADLALLAVLAATAAVIIFGIDKLRELAAPWEAVAHGLLGASAAACIAGYCIGSFRTREPIDPQTFVVDFAERSQETFGIAMLGTVRAYYANVADRRAKRLAVAFALALLVLGTVIIALARSGAR